MATRPQWTDAAVERAARYLLGDTDDFGTGAWLALYTTAPDFTGGGVEATGYSRGQLLSWSFVTNPGDGYTTATLTAAEGILSAPAATIVSWGVHDQETGGTLLAWCDLVTPITLGAGDLYLFVANDLHVAVSN